MIDWPNYICGSNGCEREVVGMFLFRRPGAPDDNHLIPLCEGCGRLPGYSHHQQAEAGIEAAAKNLIHRLIKAFGAEHRGESGANCKAGTARPRALWFVVPARDDGTPAYTVDDYEDTDRARFGLSGEADAIREARDRCLNRPYFLVRRTISEGGGISDEWSWGQSVGRSVWGATPAAAIAAWEKAEGMEPEAEAAR